MGGGGLKDAFKSFTIDPATRYRNIPKKIDHDRILPLYDTDSSEEVQFLKDKFINQQYYTRDEHRTILQKFRKGVIRKGQASISLPIRVARAFKRNRPNRNAAGGGAAEAS